jgi:hypothetical protein
MPDARTGKPPSSRHSPLIMLGAIASAMAIAACGSSSPSHSGGGLSGARGIAYADCMRSHGVPSFPDPIAGGGIQISSSSGINPFSPSFKSAQTSCAKLLPGGGPGSQHPSEQAKTEMVQTSECMRRHGVSGFPDPTLSPPSSPVGYSEVIGRGGVFLAIPTTIDVGSPVFKQAAAACAFH